MVLPKITMMRQSAAMMPAHMYAALAGSASSNRSITRITAEITAIPIPLIRHNFFSSYFSFSFFEEVLYPAINPLPRPKQKTMERITAMKNTIHATQSGPVDKSDSFNLHHPSHNNLLPTHSRQNRLSVSHEICIDSIVSCLNHLWPYEASKTIVLWGDNVRFVTPIHCLPSLHN